MSAVIDFTKKKCGDLQDWVMWKCIGDNILYNISWEDPRIDRELLTLGSEDTLLMLTSAGCNVWTICWKDLRRLSRST